MRWERRWMEIETRRNHFFSWIVISASRIQKFFVLCHWACRGKIEHYLKVTSWFLQIYLATIYLYVMRDILSLIVEYLTVSIPQMHPMLSKETKILLFLFRVSLGLEAGFHLICFYQCIRAKVCALDHGYNFESFLCWKLPQLANRSFSAIFSGSPAKMMAFWRWKEAMGNEGEYLFICQIQLWYLCNTVL